MVQQKVSLDKGSQKYEEIRNTMVQFLSRCGFEYPRNVRVDPAFEEDCRTECIRRGYDMKKLEPFLRVGIDIADPCYSHLENKEIKRFSALFTAFLSYLDDSCQKDDGAVYVSSFLRRFMNNEPQEDKILDDFAGALKEINVHWRPVAASLIHAAIFSFICSLFIDNETKDMQLGSNAVQYPSFCRRLAGVSEAYAIMTFPPEMPTSDYVQAIPDIRDYTNYVNDIMSFYKEELQGEKLNYISLVGKTQNLEKMDCLRMVSDQTAKSHERILNLLTGEARKCYEAYSEGYVIFHALSHARYKLDQLMM